MSKIRSGLFRLTAKAADSLIQKKTRRVPIERQVDESALEAHKNIPEKYLRFDKFPQYQLVVGHQVIADMLNIRNPFFRAMDSQPLSVVKVEGQEVINFCSYNYLGLTGHPRVSHAAIDAIQRFGTSAAGSRVVSGERSLTRELEQRLAAVHGVDDALVFVSGHATNVTTIGHLFDKDDLIVHDELIHNSTLEGARLSGATRFSFSHNQPAKLEQLLMAKRHQFKRVLIALEGLYGMDGDIPDLSAFIDIKRRYGCFLMCDEAHSLGVLGQHGEGIGEHCHIERRDVDIWMGTLSKALAGCGGYIAGSHALIEMLRAGAPGQVYSVGIAPPLAAASLEALKVMYDEPERLSRLRQNAAYFFDQAREQQLPMLNCQGFAVIPIICGSSKKAVTLSNRMFDEGVYALPIIYPAVPENLARLRFFISANHTAAQIDKTIALLAKHCHELGLKEQ